MTNPKKRKDCREWESEELWGIYWSQNKGLLLLLPDRENEAMKIGFIAGCEVMLNALNQLPRPKPGMKGEG